MTKKELALAVKKRLEAEGITNISQSSSYAVARETLGELSGQDLDYAKDRAGIGAPAYKDLLPPEWQHKRFFSLREVLASLPE